MKLVVDTNILISFFRDNPVRWIICNSQKLNLKLYSPEHCWKELFNIKSSISKYSKLSLKKINLIFKELKDFLVIVRMNLLNNSNRKLRRLYMIKTFLYLLF